MAQMFAKHLALFALTIAILSSRTHASVNHEDQSSLNEDDAEQTGFVESINFNDFFEDVGLQGAHSEPAVAQQPYRVAQEDRTDGSATDGFRDDGFMPSEPMRGFEASPSNLYEITSDQDFYASESSPFDDFYGFDDHSDHGRSHPFAASRNRRIYSSPSEHRPFTSDDFRDFGPPKGFFNDAFDGELKKAQSAQLEEQKKQIEEKEDPSKKKCETVEKSGMTCEVCNDGYGGFSEHCSHRLNSGKDQKYANSRRNAKDGVYKPRGPDEGFHPHETEEPEDTSRKQASNPEPENYPRRRNIKRKQRPQQDPAYDDERILYDENEQLESFNSPNHDHESSSPSATPHSPLQRYNPYGTHASSHSNFQPSPKSIQRSYKPAHANSIANNSPYKHSHNQNIHNDRNNPYQEDDYDDYEDDSVNDESSDYDEESDSNAKVPSHKDHQRHQTSQTTHTDDDSLDSPSVDPYDEEFERLFNHYKKEASEKEQNEQKKAKRSHSRSPSNQQEIISDDDRTPIEDAENDEEDDEDEEINTSSSDNSGANEDVTHHDDTQKKASKEDITDDADNAYEASPRRSSTRKEFSDNSNSLGRSPNYEDDPDFIFTVEDNDSSHHNPQRFNSRSSSDAAPAYHNRRRNEPKRHVRRHHNVQPVAAPHQDKKSEDLYLETTADKVYVPKKKNRNNNKHFGKDAFYDPYPDHSHFHPYYFGDVAEIDRPAIPDYGLEDHGHDLHAAANQAARNKKRIKTLGDELDHYSSSSARVNLKPIDAEANFKVLNKMMKKFSKKDRKNCEKRTTKKGMTCYVCPNKHGQVDEECMYENDDPSKGVHMMYKEESSY